MAAKNCTRPEHAGQPCQDRDGSRQSAQNRTVFAVRVVIISIAVILYSLACAAAIIFFTNN